MDFRLWDLPAQIDYFDVSFDSDFIFSGVGGIIWVIDVGDTYELTASRLTDTIVRLSEVYPDIKYSVFCHKTDSISEDIVSEIVTEIIQNISDDLFDAGIENPMLNHYSTSIFDHTVFEAFSKVVQGLVPQLGTYEALLDNLHASCRFEKVYLMDVRSRIYIASDTNPDNVKAYECCSDYIGTVVDVVDLFDYDRKKNDTSERAKDIASTPTESMATFGACTVLLRELNPFLAVVGVSHESDFFQERAMVNHNVQKFSDAISKVIVRK